MKKLIFLILLLFAISCENKDKKYPMGFTKEEYELIIVSYKKGWRDGANASTDTRNRGNDITIVGDSLFKIDSILFMNLINDIN